MNCLRTCWLVALASAVQLSALAATFYVRPTGDDSAAGNSPASAWRTIARVNGQDLNPGDSVLFEGGQGFHGNLMLDADDAGQSNALVAIGSFGGSKARLISGNGTGILVQSAAHITLRDLIVEGSGPTNNTANGILCDNLFTNRGMLDGLTIDNVEVSGFGKHGIMVSGEKYGFRTVRIEHTSMRNNLRGGMEVAGRLPWDAKHYAHADVIVRDCRAYDNTGDPHYNRNHSGSGIVLYQVDGGLIENCSAWNNGAMCPAGGGGPVGIWTCASRRVIIQYCESFNNKTRGLDGGGFDIDGGSEECVLQYNYSHDNIGPGLMVYTYPYASHRDQGNIVRFNISVNDAVDSQRYAGLWVRADEKSMSGVHIHNNTIITRGAQAAYVFGKNVEAVLRNNIFITGTEGTSLRVEDGGAHIQISNNLYWRTGAPFHVLWNNKPFDSLSSWRQASGQELLSGQATGLFTDPRIAALVDLGSNGKAIDFGKLQLFKPENPLALTNGINLSATFSSAHLPRDIIKQILAGPFPLGAVGSKSH